MRISTENLGKRFNREWIFRNMNLTFESGNTYAIIGPNGSGKSTLLQILWGQMPSTSGTISYRKDEATIPAGEIYRYLSIVTPQMELIDEFTLEEMVAFHFKFKKLIPAIRATEIIQKMELTQARNKLIFNFSSGMKQRLKLALAFFSQSEILFLDEPSTNLDRQAWGWYRTHLGLLADRLVFIGSNQEREYPENAVKIDLMEYKGGLQTKSEID